MKRARLALVIALTLVSATAEAQKQPDSERGARPGLAYRLEGLDHVNLFNGTLTLNIPLGQRYTINGTLSYAFMASYATNAWDSGTHEICYFDSDGFKCDEYPYQYPAESTNAGLGWMVTLGHLHIDADEQLSYVAPDGSEHTFFTTLHAGNPAETVDTSVLYTRDGTYLRLRRLSLTSKAGIVAFPGGETHSFDDNGRLTRIDDRFGNYVIVSYSLQSSADPDFNGQPLWTITDSVGRQHKVYFRRSWRYYERLWGENVDHSVVSRVELAAFNGSTAGYDFVYDALPPAQPPTTLDTNLSTSRRCVGKDDPQTPDYIYVPLLRAIDMPEGVRYAMEIDRGNRTDCSRVPSGGISGNITRLTLPTGGTIDWTYQKYAFLSASVSGREAGIRASYNAGIASRTTSLGGRTEYELGVVDSTDMWSDQYRLVKNYDRDVLLNQTKHYFSACRSVLFPCSGGRSPGDYGLPFSRTAGTAGDGFLSTEAQVVEDGTVVTRRRSYLRYEFDVPATFTSEPVNQRVRYERTVHLDDGNRYTDVTHSDFDGLGHYRKSVTGGNFERENSRTDFTNYNPGVGTYEFDSSGNLQPGYTMLSANAPWILNTFDRQWSAENVARSGEAPATQVAESRHCFDANGFLTSRYTYKNLGTSPGVAPATHPEDLLAVFTREPVNGRLNVTERYYAGQTSFACGNAPPAGETYRLRHEYENGVVARSWYTDSAGGALSFLVADSRIDANTGLAASTRRFRTNTANSNDGAATTYTYDLLGRPTEARSSTAIVSHAYTVRPPAITTSEKNAAGTVLRTTSMQFDALGRLVRETRRMPDGSTAARETAYNALGWIISTLDWGASVPTVFTHDSFGRPVRIRTPAQSDDTATTVAYTGTSRISRTRKVATGGTIEQPSLSSAVATEDYDRHGRLIRLTEPAQSVGGTRPVTEYFYDVGGRVMQVCSNLTGAGCGQTRNFVFDGRGFLTSETQPENGTTNFEYDARGHVTRRHQGNGVFDLRFTYDRAERLVAVDEKLGAVVRPLKRFDFYQQNAAGNMGNGQLRDAVRYNWLLNGFTVQVRETYTYGDDEGRATARKTRDYYCAAGQPCTSLYAGTQLHEFDQTFAYDPLGAPAALGYPKCLMGGCTSLPDRTVNNTYSQGFLTEVRTGNDVNTLSYHRSGMVNEVRHANNVLDTHTPDPAVPSRPATIATTNLRVAAPCLAPSFTRQPKSETISTGGSVTLQTAAEGQDGMPISYTWYQGTAPNRNTQVGTGTSYLASPDSTTSYWVEARNDCAGGSATESQTVTVTVCDRPAISNGPSSKSITRGQTAKLVVGTVTGTRPFTYQWYTVINNVASQIVGETSALIFVTPTQTTRYRVVVSNACNTASADATVTVLPPPTVPQNVRATYDPAANVVAVRWDPSTGSGGLNGYLINRQPDNRFFTAGASDVSFNDNNDLVAGTAYSYTVRARDVRDYYSEPSALDFATIVAFTEAIRPPGEGPTPIRGQHIDQLRQAVDAVRRLAGLPAIWNGQPATSGPIRASFLTDLRDRLNEARVVLQFEPLAFSDPVGSGQMIRGSSMRELRAGVE